MRKVVEQKGVGPTHPATSALPTSCDPAGKVLFPGFVYSRSERSQPAPSRPVVGHNPIVWPCPQSGLKPVAGGLTGSACDRQALLAIRSAGDEGREGLRAGFGEGRIAGEPGFDFLRRQAEEVRDLRLVADPLEASHKGNRPEPATRAPGTRLK